jgi:hypothetical protein
MRIPRFSEIRYSLAGFWLPGTSINGIVILQTVSDPAKEHIHLQGRQVTTGGPTFLDLPDPKCKPNKHSASGTIKVLAIHAWV